MINPVKKTWGSLNVPLLLKKYLSYAYINKSSTLALHFLQTGEVIVHIRILHMTFHSIPKSTCDACLYVCTSHLDSDSDFLFLWFWLMMDVYSLQSFTKTESMWASLSLPINSLIWWFPKPHLSGQCYFIIKRNITDKTKSTLDHLIVEQVHPATMNQFHNYWSFGISILFQFSPNIPTAVLVVKSARYLMTLLWNVYNLLTQFVLECELELWMSLKNSLDRQAERGKRGTTGSCIVFI